jgi:hypothetical protein
MWFAQSWHAAPSASHEPKDLSLSDITWGYIIFVGAALVFAVAGNSLFL